MNFLLVLNKLELSAPVDEQEAIVLRVASGQISREDFTAWVQRQVVPRI